MKRTSDYLRPSRSAVHGCVVASDGCLLPLLILSLLAALPLSCASGNADKQILAIYGPVHVYRSEIPPAVYPGSDFVDTIGPKDHVKVMQVAYRQGYLAVRIQLRDGREGWVFSGESIELLEPHRISH